MLRHQCGLHLKQKRIAPPAELPTVGVVQNARVAAELEVLLQMPARQVGKSRLDTLLYQLDAGIRARIMPQGA